MYRWWKNLQLQANFSFTRDRIVENYFWMAGAYFEPMYSRGRIILTMVMATIVILDDIYDAYGTSEECELFTKCIEWFVYVFHFPPRGMAYRFCFFPQNDIPFLGRHTYKQMSRKTYVRYMHIGPI